MTQQMLADLRAQIVRERLHIVVIDDGSTDGTREYLAAQSDVVTLAGDGNLWWAGAIQRGLDYVLKRATDTDWILFANNDIELRPDFLATLLQVAEHHGCAAVGSVIRDLEPPHQLLSIGAKIDAWAIITRDRMDEPGASGDSPVPVDALSGRGVLYPATALRAVGGMRPRWLPHYLADYELSLRVARKGWRLLVSPRAAVYSRDEYGNSRPLRSLWERIFSVRSPFYLPALLRFWWEASNWPQRLTLPLRGLYFFLFPNARKTR